MILIIFSKADLTVYGHLVLIRKLNVAVNRLHLRKDSNLNFSVRFKKLEKQFN